MSLMLSFIEAEYMTSVLPDPEIDLNDTQYLLSMRSKIRATYYHGFNKGFGSKF